MTAISATSRAARAAAAAATAAQKLNRSADRLATGKRINSAADDAGGLGVAASMTAQLRGYAQGVRNAQDGIAMAQTAEGATTEIGNALQRMRELAVQSASGIYNDDDRAKLQSEVEQLSRQLEDITANTRFNDFAVFGSDGGGFTASIQVGIREGQTVDIVVGDMDLAAVTDSGLTIGTQQDASSALAVLDDAIRRVIDVRAEIGGSIARLESNVNSLSNNALHLNDARSRIEDADYASETAQLAQSQILSQSSTAMIAQANLSQRDVTALLR